MFCGIAILESCKPSLSKEHLSNPNSFYLPFLIILINVPRMQKSLRKPEMPSQTRLETKPEIFSNRCQVVVLKKKGWSYLGSSSSTCLAQAAERSSEPPSGFSWRQSFTWSGEHPQDKALALSRLMLMCTFAFSDSDVKIFHVASALESMAVWERTGAHYPPSSIICWMDLLRVLVTIWITWMSYHSEWLTIKSIELTVTILSPSNTLDFFEHLPLSQFNQFH